MGTATLARAQNVLPMGATTRGRTKAPLRLVRRGGGGRGDRQPDPQRAVRPPSTRHWRFDDSRITDEVVEGRRTSGYFVPVPQARHQGAELAIETEWTLDRLEPNDLVNQLRSRLDLWRRQGRPHVTSTTWGPARAPVLTRPGRRLFFAQLEAADTAICLVEAATKPGNTWVHEQLRQSAAEANPALSAIMEFPSLRADRVR